MHIIVTETLYHISYQHVYRIPFNDRIMFFYLQRHQYIANDAIEDKCVE